MKSTAQKNLETFLDTAPRMLPHLAPKHLQIALANSEKARLAANTAEYNRELAPLEVQQAKAAWAVVAEAAVREGKPLPTQELVDRAVIGVTVADKNLATVETLRNALDNKVGEALAQPTTRTEWQTALELRAGAIQTDIRKIGEELLPLYNQLNQALAATQWLRTYPNTGPPVGPLYGSLDSILTDAINAKPTH